MLLGRQGLDAVESRAEGPRGGEALVQPADLQIGVGGFGGDRQAHARTPSLSRGGVRARGPRVISQAPEEVDLPNRAEVDVVKVSGALIAGEVAEQLARGGLKGASGPRRLRVRLADGQKLGARRSRRRPRLIHPRPGCGEIKVL